MDIEAAGRELAQLIHRLLHLGDRALHDRVTMVDWAFIHSMDPGPVVKALAPLPPALAAKDEALSARFAQFMELLGNLDELDFEKLAWEYRDERVVQRLQLA